MDHGIHPDVITLNVLIDAFCKEGMTKEAHKPLDVIVRIGEEPNAVTCRTIIDGYCFIGQIDEANKVFHFMI